MTLEKWQDIKSMVKDKFKNIIESIEPIYINSEPNGEKDILIFDSPLGKTKLEFIKKAVILDKKEFYSKRMGSDSRTEYTLSDNEFSYKMDVYTWNTNIDDWDKIDSKMFSNDV
jgi:hypothetical protein